MITNGRQIPIDGPGQNTTVAVPEEHENLYNDHWVSDELVYIRIGGVVFRSTQQFRRLPNEGEDDHVHVLTLDQREQNGWRFESMGWARASRCCPMEMEWAAFLEHQAGSPERTM